MTANVKVEISFTDGALTASPTWTDVSAYVDLSQSVTLNRGRSRTSTDPEPGRCTLTLLNDDGRFTWGNVAGAYGLGLGDQPQLRQPIRVSIDPDGGGYDPVWTGYVDEWVGGWDNGYRPIVRVTASDRLARLALLNLNDPAITAEIRYDNPVAYYPLNDPSGSESAGDQAGPNVRPLAVVSTGAGAGTVDFGYGASPDGSSETVAVFTPTSNTNGKYLTGSGPTVSTTNATIEAWVYDGGPQDANIASAFTPGISMLSIQTAADGDVYMEYTEQSVSPSAASIATGYTLSTTGWVHLAVVVDGSTMRSYINGVAGVTDSVSGTPTLSIQSVAIAGGQLILQNPTITAWEGQVAHVAVYDTALSADRILAHYEAGQQVGGPFYGDTASERFERLCRLAGLPSALYATDATATTVLGAQDLDGVGLLDALRQVTDSERGIIRMNGSGVLTYDSAATLASQAVALTLDEHDVNGDVSLTTNDANLVNDVTVTRPNGATQRRTDATSVAQIGANQTTVDTLLTTDAEAGALADLLLSQGLVVRPVTDDLTLDLLTKSSTIDAATAIALDTGDRVTLTGLPTGAPSSSIDVLVEGVAHTITAVRWDLTLTVSPASTLPSWVLEDATYGVLGSTTRLAYP